jgi:TolB-like protein
MKSIFKLFLLCTFVIITSFLTGCTSGAKPAENGNLTLDQAIKNASEEIDARFETGVKVALLNFNSTSDQFSAYVLDELTANLVNSRHLTIIDRNEIDLIRRELDFQMSGDVDDNSIQALGRMLGAQSIVSGSLTNIGDEYRIMIRVLNVQSATIEVQYRVDIANDRRVASLLGDNRSSETTTTSVSGGNSGGNTLPSTTASVTPAPKQSKPTSNQTYKIGDTGPAGGTVFYDKGSYTDSWRYLEYAPNNFRSVYWGPYGLNIAGTETRIGSGKINTEIIVRVLNRRGEKGMAAQLCSEYTLNGHNDWFLPSKDELNLLYTYLKENILLESRFGFYGWLYSSSQYDDTNAWGHNFTNGYQGGYHKNISDGYVRAVRAF